MSFYLHAEHLTKDTKLESLQSFAANKLLEVLHVLVLLEAFELRKTCCGAVQITQKSRLLRNFIAEHHREVL